jgi:hypothetical protein
MVTLREGLSFLEKEAAGRSTFELHMAAKKALQNIAERSAAKRTAYVAARNAPTSVWQYLKAMVEKHGPGAAIGTAGVLGTAAAAKGGTEWLKDKKKEAAATPEEKFHAKRQLAGLAYGGVGGGLLGAAAGERAGRKYVQARLNKLWGRDPASLVSALGPRVVRGRRVGAILGAGLLGLGGAELGLRLSKNWDPNVQAREAQEDLEEDKKREAEQNLKSGSEKKASFNSAAKPLEKSAYTTMSSPSNNGSMSAGNESAEDSRKRRLAELLKKREHSGTATGSASPNPPKGD